MGPMGWEVKAMLSCGPVCSPAPVGANRTLTLEFPCDGAVSFVQSALVFPHPGLGFPSPWQSQGHWLLLHQAFSPTYRSFPV